MVGTRPTLGVSPGAGAGAGVFIPFVWHRGLRATLIPSDLHLRQSGAPENTIGRW